MSYEDLLNEAASQGLIVKEKTIDGYGGRIFKNRIAINNNLTGKEKAAVLAEELGHHYTSVGDILDQTDIRNRKQERKARSWGYQKLIQPRDIAIACLSGCHTAYDLSEYLDLPQQYVEEALQYFSEAYGEQRVYFSDCAIQFAPKVRVWKYTEF